MATSLILSLTIVLLFSTVYQINDATVKGCTDESMDNETTTSSSGSQEESNSFTSYASGTDDKTKEVNDGRDVSLVHTKSQM